MGLFSSIFGKKNKGTHSVKKNSVPEEFEYFARILQENFLAYEIESRVLIERFDPYVTEEALPISFLLSQDGRPKLAILLMDPHFEYNHDYAKITEKVCEERHIPYLRFFLTWRNEENYVINRIRKHLR